ncbi:hypothetical protein [Bacillus paramycoides]|uniref:hypothetical protein n=1 Tax=Bacillus paramycoides TaxID=2026194 RepID=UPI001FC8FF4C|nr:hypothetical protein [Bacillus paramycoides]
MDCGFYKDGRRQLYELEPSELEKSTIVVVKGLRLVSVTYVSTGRVKRFDFI